MKTVTVRQFMEFGPCRGEEEIRRIAGGREEWTALDVLALDGVPAADRLWAVLREDFTDAHVLHEFACRCAERALAGVPEPDPRSVAAVAAKRAWLRGETGDAELAAAWDAARAAVKAAVCGDACAAACAAAKAAAWAAIGDAASAAAWAAASAAQGDAASAAEREWQVRELASMLGGGRP